MAEPHASVEVEHAIGSLRVIARAEFTAPWTILFGPSGSGKSTLLRLIAGLLKPQQGGIVLAGQVVADARQGIWIPAHRRPMRWAGQQDALFPHATVQDNLPAGLSAAPGRGGGIEVALDHFELRPFAGLMPAQLSGGERRRVSIARAAAGARGKLLLLDEPFTGLDAAVRTRLITQLRSWLGDTPVISVTHDVGEAFELGAEIVRLAEGRLVAQGPVAEVLADERAQLESVLDGTSDA